MKSPSIIDNSAAIERRRFALAMAGGAILAACAVLGARQASAATPSIAEVLAASDNTEWREPLDEHTLYLQLPAGRVIIELAPQFAPLHVGNIKTLVRAGYFDGLAVLRAQDNFVVQWGDPDDSRSLGAARDKVPPEFTADWAASSGFTRLRSADGYAAEVGFVHGMPAARDPPTRRSWLAHCYGSVGVARGNEPESGNGTSLYVAIGHAPRQLDRNAAVVGRVIGGMEHLSALPRGAGALGFYQQAAQRTPIAQARIAVDVPEHERTRLEVLRTDSASFHRLVATRRHRQDEWLRQSPNYIDLCNVPLPVRAARERDSR